jgi:hypothetical protein
VCKNDQACSGFKLRLPDGSYPDVPAPGSGSAPDGEDGSDVNDMVCYKGGVAARQNFQMCDVTNRKIIDTIPDHKSPQVTFSCAAGGPSSNTTMAHAHSALDPYSAIDAALNDGERMGTCNFQFWVDRNESFYCLLDRCSWLSEDNIGT